MNFLDSPPDPSTFVAGAEPGSWVLAWRGKKFAESDLTGQHLSVISLISGSDDFASLDVDPRHGHQRLMMVLAAFIAVDATASLGDVDEATVAGLVAEAVESVSAASAEEILGSLTFA